MTSAAGASRVLLRPVRNVSGNAGKAAPGIGNTSASNIPGQYLEDLKPSPTPAQLVQQQAGQPGATASIRFDHIIVGGVNTLADGTKVGTGGHYLRSPDVRVTQQTGAADALGVTKGHIEVRDPETGRWVAKPQESTFYPESWSRRQVQQEIEGAFQNSAPIPGTPYWQGVSPSGIKIQGYYGKPNGTGATAWPVYQGVK